MTVLVTTMINATYCRHKQNEIKDFCIESMWDIHDACIEGIESQINTLDNNGEGVEVNKTSSNESEIVNNTLDTDGLEFFINSCMSIEDLRLMDRDVFDSFTTQCREK